MDWDAATQAFGLRDSDWQTRTWTGALFLVAFALWFYPVLEQELWRPLRRV
jgi:hypothetical protein